MIVEKAQEKRLKKFGLNIKTKYKVDNQVLERNTDHSKVDTIHNGIILEKGYYKGVLLKKENLFDSRMTYTYEVGKRKFTCKNCGMTSTEENDECPYCHTNFNMDYDQKELGSKHYFDLTVKNKSYITKTFIISFLVSLVISILLILPNSRTFYVFDVLKILGAALLGSLILFYFFYYLDAYILLPSLKAKKERQNHLQQEFWNRMKEKNIDKIKFFNNLNYELREYYYSDLNKDVIDFDILDYNSFKDIEENNDLFVEVNLDIRIIHYNNNKITSKLESKSYKLKHIKEFEELSSSVNQISCPSCGASIDVTKDKCEYCGRKINYYQEWYLMK